MLAAAAAVALLVVPTRGHADLAACGIPAAAPLWVDYAGHSAPITPKPGMVLAVTSGTTVPAQMRAAGAATIYFDLSLNKRVGTTTAPADPSTIEARAKSEFAFAQQVTGCQTPLIAENELFGAQTETPWTPNNAQYRANVLALLQDLDALGATTALTIANPPYTGGDAANWWRAAAKASILVRQVYFTSPGPKGLYKEGPLLASRSMRKGMRGLIAHFSQIGIPASRVALELQFQSAPGEGGRNGLQPKDAWFEIVKEEALAAKQVAAETKIQGVWSWGWPSFSAAGDDPDKPAAACVYLWARDQSLCDGPAMAGPGFDASLTEGQIDLAANVRCTFGPKQTILKSDVARAGAITGDLTAGASALLQRVVLRTEAPVPAASVLAAERAIVRDQFGGSRARYRAALKTAGVALQDARAIIADRLGRERIEERFKPPAPTAAQIAAFDSTYAATQVRLVSVTPEAPWLGDAYRGFAVETIAPKPVFTLPLKRKTKLDTVDGSFTVQPLGPSLPLYALPPASQASVARQLLGRFAKDQVYAGWLGKQEAKLEQTATCSGDQLPATGDVDLGAFVPFLGD